MIQIKEKYTTFEDLKIALNYIVFKNFISKLFITTQFSKATYYCPMLSSNKRCHLDLQSYT